METPDSPAPDADTAPAKADGAPSPNAEAPVAPVNTAPTGRAVWWEVVAVVAVGVLPNLFSAVAHLYVAFPPLPYWLDALHLGGISACTIFVTLYLIARSGEPWERFGLGRPHVLDLVLGGLMLIVAIVVSDLVPRFPDSGARTSDIFARPGGPGDYVLMPIKYALSAFAEEVVTRAYLITRLSMLLRSRGEAVVFAAVLFASYHAYQGIDGLVYTFAFGVVYGAAFLALGRVWPLAIGHALYNIRLDVLSAWLS